MPDNRDADMDAELDTALEELLMGLDEAFDDLPPIPGHLHDAALAAYEWRRADAVLAELLYDSATDALAGVRAVGVGTGATERRSFRFGAHDSVIRVHLTQESLIVMIEPPLSIVCRVASGYRGGQIEDHRTDELGELALDAPELPVRIELDFPGGTVVTPWIIG